MGDFDKIISKAKEYDESYLKHKVDAQAEIIELKNTYKSFGQAKYYQSKNYLKNLTTSLENTFNASNYEMFNNLMDIDEDQAEDSKDNLMLQLKDALNSLVENSRKYSEFQGTFDIYNLDESIKQDQEAFIKAAESINSADKIFDKLMMYDISDTKEFDKLYVEFNNLKQKYSEIAEGSMVKILDNYEDGKKVLKIEGKNPKTDIGLAKRRDANDKKKAENQIINMEAKWINEGEPLFSHDPCPEDIMQGQVGDCYLIAALTSIAAQNPDRIREMIKLKHVEEKDPDDPAKTKTNTYAVVRLYSQNNEPVDVTVPYSSCYITGTKNGEPVQDPLYAGGAAWVKMIEKAYVVSGLGKMFDDQFKAAQKGKYNPDYDEVAGGESHLAMQVLLGPEMTNDPDAASLQNFSVPLPSTKEYTKIEAYFENTKKKKVAEATNQIKNSNDFLEKIKNKLKTDIEKKRFKLQQGNKIDETINNIMDNPEKAEQYYSFENEEQRNSFNIYFSSAKSKINEHKGNLENSQKILDHYDHVKNNRPEKFPSDYTNEEKNMFNCMLTSFNKGQAMATGSALEATEDGYQSTNGIPHEHAYSITNVFEAKNGVKYVEIKNPHNYYGRKYDEKGNPILNNDPDTKGYSTLEFRDFCKTFNLVFFGNYNPRQTYKFQEEELKETLDLYKDALHGICFGINKSDKDKKSPSYNELRGAAKTLLEKLNNKEIRCNDLKASINVFFEKATIYHNQMKDLNPKKIDNNAANKFLAAEAALLIKEKFEENNKKTEGRQRVDIDDIFNKVLDVKETDCEYKKKSAGAFKNIKKEQNQKAADSVKKALAGADKIADAAKKKLTKAIQKQNEQDIISSIATLVFIDDVKNKKDVSPQTIINYCKEKEIKNGANRLKNSVTEALSDLLAKNGAENLLKALADTDKAVNIIRQNWDEQLKERHPEMFAEKKDAEKVKENKEIDQIKLV